MKLKGLRNVIFSLIELVLYERKLLNFEHRMRGNEKKIRMNVILHRVLLLEGIIHIYDESNLREVKALYG